MNKVLITLTFLLSLVMSCKVQNHDPSFFIPKGYIEVDKYFGDLNKDGKDDCVLLIKKTDTNHMITNSSGLKVDRNRRGILVVFKNDNGYHLIDKNYECFSSENEDGGSYFPPELRVEIKKGNLQVRYEHGRYGYWNYTFRFQNSNFEMIGYDKVEQRGSYIEQEISINFLTKKKWNRRNTHIPEHEKDLKATFDDKWSNINLDKLIKLSEVEDFDLLPMHTY